MKNNIFCVNFISKKLTKQFTNACNLWHIDLESRGYCSWKKKNMRDIVLKKKKNQLQMIMKPAKSGVCKKNDFSISRIIKIAFKLYLISETEL